MKAILVALCLTAIVGGHPRPALAQSDYRNTDSGRPLRIEDAEAIERHAIEFAFAPFRVDWLQNGIARLQYEPRLSYGILARTELELRAPIVQREPSAYPQAGLAGLGVGVFRNINDETPTLPSFAVAGEYVVPAGGVATKPGTWVVRGIATRSWAVGRLHVNAAYGTYNLITYPASPVSPGCTQNCGGIPFIPINDGPCDLEPPDGSALPTPPATRLGQPIVPTPVPTRVGQQIVPVQPAASNLPIVAQGRRVLLGLAGDHSFALSSTMIGADIFVERFSLSTSPADWSAELGARHQMTPQLVIDAGVGRRFTGASPAWFATVGSSYAFSAAAIGLHGNCP